MEFIWSTNPSNPQKVSTLIKRSRGLLEPNECNNKCDRPGNHVETGDSFGGVILNFWRFNKNPSTSTRRSMGANFRE